VSHRAQESRIEQPAPLDVQRAALRVTSDFFLRITSLLSGLMDRDLIRGLIWLGIVEANVRRVNLDPELSEAFASSETPLTDDLREPVSVYALAQTLRLPYETTRRYVQKLIDAGQAVRVERGVIVPQEAMEAPPVRLAAVQFHASLRRFMEILVRIGAYPELLGPAPAGHCPHLSQARNGAPSNFLRRMARSTNSFYLRTAEVLADAADGDLVRGIVFLGVIQANIQTLNSDLDLSLQYGGVENIPPDDIRRPISVYALAQSLDLPYETTRRYVQKMIEDGRCVREPAGIVAPATVLAQPPIRAAVERNYANLSNFTRTLLKDGLDPRPTAI
jgi:predicted transcriptional regulator